MAISVLLLLLAVCEGRKHLPRRITGGARAFPFSARWSPLFLSACAGGKAWTIRLSRATIYYRRERGSAYAPAPARTRHMQSGGVGGDELLRVIWGK